MPLVLTLCGVVLAGVCFSWWLANRETDRLKRSLLEAVLRSAPAISPECLTQLTGTPSETTHPQYRHLKQSLQILRTSLPQQPRFVYIIRQVNSQVVFLADSEPPGSKDESPPGQVYPDATPEMLQAVTQGRPGIDGPARDQWGIWVSAYAPLTDPHTGKLLAVLGVDLDGKVLAQAQMIEWLKGLILTGLAAIAAALFFSYRQGLKRIELGAVPPPVAPWSQHWAPALIVALIGATATLMGFMESRRSAMLEFESSFYQQASARAETVLQPLLEGMEHLNQLRFVTADSPNPTAVALPFLPKRRFAIDSLSWAPQVAVTQRLDFARRTGLTIVPPLEPAGLTNAWFYPLQSREPQTCREPALGFNLASDPACRAAIAQALQTSALTASASTRLSPGTNSPATIQVFAPVYEGGIVPASQDQRVRRLRGFLAAAFRTDTLFDSLYQGLPPQGLPIQITDLQAPEGRQLLFRRVPRLGRVTWDPPAIHWSRTMEVADRLWQVTVVPSSTFLAGNQRHDYWWFLPIGLGTSTLLGLYLNNLLAGRLRAEQMVRCRTAALSEETQRLALVLSSTRAGLWDWNIPSGVIIVNERWAEIAGYSLAELSPVTMETWKRLCHPEDWKKSTQLIEAHFAGQQPYYHCECRMRHKLGHWIWIHSRGQVVARDAANAPLRMTGTHLDITERKEAEEAQSASEIRFRLMFEQHDAVMLLLAPDNCLIIDANQAAARFYGYSQAQLCGMKLEAIDLLPPEAIQQHIRDAMAGRRNHFHFRHRLADGTIREVEVHSTAMQFPDQTSLFSIVHDITKRKEAEEQLRLSKEVLESTNRDLERATAQASELAVRAELSSLAKSQFLANMSHEIRTPMNGIIGMTGMLLETPLTAEQRKYAEIVRSSGETLLALINDILDFSKIEAKKLTLEALDFELPATLEDAAEMLALRAHEKGLELSCLIERDVPTTLRGDPGRLRQIVVNLVGNGIKFTHQGDIALRVSLASKTASHATLRFTVRDTGIGIPANRVDSIFAPFVQVDGSTTRKYGGTGLGLAICKQLAAMMGGSIGVESTAGSGSTFWFTATFEIQAQAAARPETRVDLSPLKILVVDDHASNRQVAVHLLTAAGGHAEEAPGGAEALAQLRAARRSGQPFHAALVDDAMPGISGESLARQILSDQALADTRLVLMSPLGHRKESHQWKAQGFCACLTKPLRTSPFQRCMKTLLAHCPPSPATAAPGPGLAPGLAPGPRKRILVAEDNPANQEVTLAILRKLGYEADAVANGIEAVKSLETIPYDLVLMDCQMPEMDGYEASRRLRAPAAKLANPAAPIIALTANALESDMGKCLAAGMSDYLAKPVHPRQLALMLGKWLAPGAAATSPPAIAEPPPAKVIFNQLALVERLMGDRTLARKILNQFMREFPKSLAALEQAIAQHQLVEAHNWAHSLKGAAATVAAEALSEAALEMEQQAESGHTEALADGLKSLKKEFEMVSELWQKSGWI